MAYPELKKITKLVSIGNISATLTGQHDPGYGILDTEVTIEGKNLCCITWNDRENFILELNQVIDKYRI